MRTAHAFGSSFVFTVDAHHKAFYVNETDTSKSLTHLPHYEWDNVDDMRLPVGCALVGVELCEAAVDLPTFKHPLAGAYVLGPEKGSLSAEVQSLCTHIVKIPTKFCINVSLAAALTLYDRTLCLGGYPERPMLPGGPNLAALEEWEKLKLRKG